MAWQFKESDKKNIENFLRSRYGRHLADEVYDNASENTVKSIIAVLPSVISKKRWRVKFEETRESMKLPKVINYKNVDQFYNALYHLSDNPATWDKAYLDKKHWMNKIVTLEVPLGELVVDSFQTLALTGGVTPPTRRVP